MNTTLEEKKCKANVVRKCWKYFDDNFHKLNQANKIKIALALCSKDLPTELKGEGLDGMIKNIIVFRNPEAVKEDADSIRNAKAVKL